MGIAITPFSSSLFSTSVRTTRIPLLLHHRYLCRRQASFLQTEYCRSSKLRRNTSCGVVALEDGIEGDGQEDEACELVSGEELCIGEDDDNIQAYLFKAVKNNNRTGVLLLSDVFGFQDSSTRDFAYRIACTGYNVLVPDLFRGDPWGKNRPAAGFQQWLATQDPQRVAKDIDIATQWMVAEFIAAGISKKLAIVGFCFGGGRLIEVLAQDKSDHFGAGVSFYGTRMDLSIAADVKIPVLFIAGDGDSLCPLSMLEDVKKRIGGEAKVVIFKGRGHGFAHRPGSQEEDDDAEKAFVLMRDWIHRNLLE
ncbi:hypothetical protein ACFE04_004210 [Oxalis oulophora]